jgi:glycosyltransferase involved in cell wall biosynthesis
MRIQIFSDHRYPADDGHGVGIATRYEPSGAPHRIHDLIARGLGELGHEVFYSPERGVGAPLPHGVTFAASPRDDVDVFHNLEAAGRPWIYTQHRTRDLTCGPENWVYVSRSLASVYGSNRFVRNGLDPDEYIYSETKDDYLLYLASMQGRAHRHKYRFKGLHVAVSLAAELGFKLRVAGTASEQEILDIVLEMCSGANVEFLGDVRGQAKAELLAGARALLFPTQIHEGLPLVIIEALFSGTPIIASHHGPCPEVVPPEVGFICRTTDDYAAAVQNAHRILPRDCRERGLRDHHYLTMARGYLREYEIEVGRFGAEPAAALEEAR